MSMNLVFSILGAIETSHGLTRAALEEIRRRQFLEEERELLREAAETGEIRVIDLDQVAAPWIRIEQEPSRRLDFMKPSDPAFAARYRQAFRSLADRGYIEHVTGHLFSLTGDGFKKARELIDRG